MKNLILFIATFLVFSSSYAGIYKKIPSQNTNTYDIISIGNPDEDYKSVTEGYHKVNTINAGGTAVEIFKKGDFYIIFNKQKSKYGWVAIKGNKEKLGLILGELIVNIYNS